MAASRLACSKRDAWIFMNSARIILLPNCRRFDPCVGGKALSYCPWEHHLVRSCAAHCPRDLERLLSPRRWRYTCFLWWHVITPVTCAQTLKEKSWHGLGSFWWTVWLFGWQLVCCVHACGRTHLLMSLPPPCITVTSRAMLIPWILISVCVTMRLLWWF